MIRFSNIKLLLTLACFVAIVMSARDVLSQERKATGLVKVFVFTQKGLPVDGAVVDAGAGMTGLSDLWGLARFVCAPSPAMEFKVSVEGFRTASFVVPVVAGEVSEAIVTLFKNSAATTDVEGPIQSKTLVETPVSGPSGRIAGVVKALEGGAPVSGCRVFVRGLDADAISDSRGRFVLELPPGTWTLSLVHPDYSTQTIDGVLVSPGEMSQVSVDVIPSSVELEEFTVEAPRIEGGVASLQTERRSSSSVADVIGAEQITKSGDSSAAGALRRVTGLTLVGGRYVYVRGMGERYSSSLLNGFTLPSPEPERRVVPLDMFPAAILESVVIQKTFSPDMPGEFGGGAVMLRSRGIPDEFLLSVGLNLGYNAGSTFEDAIMNKAGRADFLGVDDGSRALPAAVARASSDQALIEMDRFGLRGYSPATLEDLGESMPRNWGMYSGMVAPDASFNIAVGNSWKISGIKLGFTAAFAYSNAWDVEDRNSSIYLIGLDGEMELQHRYRFNTSNNSVGLGALLDFGVDLGAGHKLRLTSLLMRSTDNETRIYEGINRDVGTDISVTRFRWIERTLLSEQISGSHEFPSAGNLEFNWRYAFSAAMRYEPDRREFRYDFEPGLQTWLLSDRPEGNQRVYSDLSDYNHDVGVDFRIPFKAWNSLEGAVKTGASVIFRDRTVDTRRFKFQHKGPLSSNMDVISLSPDEIFVPENIGSDGFQLEEITRQTDNYKAGQTLVAGYAMAELPIIPGLRMTAGLRVEYSDQTVTTYELFNPDGVPIVARLAKVDALPAASLTWEFFKDMQLRLVYGMTVSRPDFRELSPATFNDVTGGRQIFGNPELERALLQNLDLRWEWYISTNENLSVAFFYKHFVGPIETIIVPSAQQSITYENATAADNLGVELEFRKNFDFIHQSVRDLYLAGNFAYIFSQVDLGDGTGIQTSRRRALQGQSPFVVNLQFGYDNPDVGTSVAVVYNVFGRRISEVGAQGAPDVFEEPFHQFDLILTQKLPKGFKLSFKAVNLIDLDATFTQGANVTERFKRGRSFTIGAGWNW